MRLFVAAVLPAAMRRALAETSGLLRGSVRGRYVAPDSFHVTLAFLGELDEHGAEAAMGAMERGCSGFEPFEIALGELGSFGKRSKATLWQGFADAGKLNDLASQIRAELDASFISFDDKTFRPHVTLMRNADLTRGELPSPCIAHGSIDTVTLFKSDLSGSRPQYDELLSVVL